MLAERPVASMTMSADSLHSDPARPLYVSTSLPVDVFSSLQVS